MKSSQRAKLLATILSAAISLPIMSPISFATKTNRNFGKDASKRQREGANGSSSSRSTMPPETKKPHRDAEDSDDDMDFTEGRPREAVEGLSSSESAMAPETKRAHEATEESDNDMMVADEGSSSSHAAAAPLMPVYDLFKSLVTGDENWGTAHDDMHRYTDLLRDNPQSALNRGSLENDFLFTLVQHAINGDRDNIYMYILKNVVLKDNLFSTATSGSSGATILHLAAMRNSEELVEFLINKEANVNVADSFGHTPLYYAFRSQSPNQHIIGILLENGAISL